MSITLPEWDVKKSQQHRHHVIITCPRRDCQKSALVHRSWSVGGHPSRPCTFCFRANKIPGRERIEPKP